MKTEQPTPRNIDDYIAEFRVADAKGNVLYPTAETRKFLEDLIRR